MGEFTDRALEAEYSAENLEASRTVTASIALVCGLILALFVVQSYISEGGTLLFARITPVRMMFIFASALMFFAARRTAEHKQFVLLVSLYQVAMALTYLLTLKHYESLNYFSAIGLLVITLAMYLLPNRITYSQVISILFSIAVLICLNRKLSGMQFRDFYRIAAYQAILLVYCNMNYCMNERTKRKAFTAKRKLQEVSVKDPLTGIYNRKKFDDVVDQWVSFSNRYGSPLSILLFDIDNFKGVNDHFGHMMGDKVLKQVVHAVQGCIREADVFARWGGDEFAILLPNTNLAEARKLAERLRGRIAEETVEGLLGVTCSFGVVEYERHDSKQSLLRKVDNLLLQAKAGGKDRVVVEPKGVGLTPY